MQLAELIAILHAAGWFGSLSRLDGDGDNFHNGLHRLLPPGLIQYAKNCLELLAKSCPHEELDFLDFPMKDKDDPRYESMEEDMLQLMGFFEREGDLEEEMAIPDVETVGIRVRSYKQELGNRIVDFPRHRCCHLPLVLPNRLGYAQRVELAKRNQRHHLFADEIILDLLDEFNEESMDPVPCEVIRQRKPGFVYADV